MQSMRLYSVCCYLIIDMFKGLMIVEEFVSHHITKCGNRRKFVCVVKYIEFTRPPAFLECCLPLAYLR